MTRVWYDSEFLEDGRTIELISIGLVTDGASLGFDGVDVCGYYAVNADAPWGRIARHPWLCENVVPHLPLVDGIEPAEPGRALFTVDTTHPTVKPRAQIAEEVRTFLTGLPRPLELWAWYGAYDHVALAQLWGPMVDLPPGIPMYTHDLKQECDRLGNPSLPGHDLDRDGIEHNAFADAAWAARAHRWLEQHAGAAALPRRQPTRA